MAQVVKDYHIDLATFARNLAKGTDEGGNPYIQADYDANVDLAKALYALTEAQAAQTRRNALADAEYNYTVTVDGTDTISGLADGTNMTLTKTREAAVRAYTEADATAYADYLIDTAGWDTVADTPGAEAAYLISKATTFDTRMGALVTSLPGNPWAQYEKDKAAAEKDWLLSDATNDGGAEALGRLQTAIALADRDFVCGIDQGAAGMAELTETLAVAQASATAKQAVDVADAEKTRTVGQQSDQLALVTAGIYADDFPDDLIPPDVSQRELIDAVMADDYTAPDPLPSPTEAGQVDPFAGNWYWRNDYVQLVGDRLGATLIRDKDPAAGPALGWSYAFNGATTQDAMADVGSEAGNDAWNDYLNLDGMGEWIVMYSPRVYSALYEARAETATALAELSAALTPPPIIIIILPEQGSSRVLGDPSRREGLSIEERLKLIQTDFQRLFSAAFDHESGAADYYRGIREGFLSGLEDWPELLKLAQNLGISATHVGISAMETPLRIGKGLFDVVTFLPSLVFRETAAEIDLAFEETIEGSKILTAEIGRKLAEVAKSLPKLARYAAMMKDTVVQMGMGAARLYLPPILQKVLDEYGAPTSEEVVRKLEQVLDAVEPAVLDLTHALAKQLTPHKIGYVVGMVIYEVVETAALAAVTGGIAAAPKLALIPWPALPGAGKDTILLQDYAFAIVPHGPFLLDQLTTEATTRDADDVCLAVGSVSYDDKPTTASQSDMLVTRAAATDGQTLRWPSLPATKEELDELETVAKGRQLTKLTGSEASTARVLAELPKARWAHFATHGFFANPKIRSALQLDEKTFERHQFLQTGERTTVIGRNPLVLSGLVFAGANLPREKDEFGISQGDGGILTAEAIAGLPLHNLDLAVLSACDTGLGEVAGGEGVFGLQRAFHIAGARNVVASLWKADDQPTAAPMRLFYHKLWVENKPPIVALRESQLALYRNPDLITDLATTRGPDFDKVVERVDTHKGPATGKTAPTKIWAAFILSGAGR